jgi:5-methylcytosine-specific restriction endonuclease McrA
MPIRPEMRLRYPRDWKLRSRFVRKVRAKNRCEWCGIANGAPTPISGRPVVLTAAHVFDKAPESASLLNLAALCQACHLAHDAEDRARLREERRAARAAKEERADG